MRPTLRQPEGPLNFLGEETFGVLRESPQNNVGYSSQVILIPFRK